MAALEVDATASKEGTAVNLSGTKNSANSLNLLKEKALRLSQKCQFIDESGALMLSVPRVALNLQQMSAASSKILQKHKISSQMNERVLAEILLAKSGYDFRGSAKLLKEIQTEGKLVQNKEFSSLYSKIEYLVENESEAYMDNLLEKSAVDVQLNVEVSDGERNEGFWSNELGEIQRGLGEVGCILQENGETYRMTFKVKQVNEIMSRFAKVIADINNVAVKAGFENIFDLNNHHHQEGTNGGMEDTNLIDKFIECQGSNFNQSSIMEDCWCLIEYIVYDKCGNSALSNCDGRLVYLGAQYENFLRQKMIIRLNEGHQLHSGIGLGFGLDSMNDPLFHVQNQHILDVINSHIVYDWRVPMDDDQFHFAKLFYIFRCNLQYSEEERTVREVSATERAVKTILASIQENTNKLHQRSRQSLGIFVSVINQLFENDSKCSNYHQSIFTSIEDVIWLKLYVGSSILSQDLVLDECAAQQDNSKRKAPHQHRFVVKDNEVESLYGSMSQVTQLKTLLLAGRFEKAILHLLQSEETITEGIHVAIGLQFYNQLNVTHENSAFLVEIGQGLSEKINFNLLIHQYAFSFYKTDLITAIQYLFLLPPCMFLEALETLTLHLDDNQLKIIYGSIDTTFQKNVLQGLLSKTFNVRPVVVASLLEACAENEKKERAILTPNTLLATDNGFTRRSDMSNGMNDVGSAVSGVDVSTYLYTSPCVGVSEKCYKLYNLCALYSTTTRDQELVKKNLLKVLHILVYKIEHLLSEMSSVTFVHTSTPKLQEYIQDIQKWGHVAEIKRLGTPTDHHPNPTISAPSTDTNTLDEKDLQQSLKLSDPEKYDTKKALELFWNKLLALKDILGFYYLFSKAQYGEALEAFNQLGITDTDRHAKQGLLAGMTNNTPYICLFAMEAIFYLCKTTGGGSNSSSSRTDNGSYMKRARRTSLSESHCQNTGGNVMQANDVDGGRINQRYLKARATGILNFASSLKADKYTNSPLDLLPRLTRYECLIHQKH